ncbi:uncharacterized protein LOC111946974 [Oryzias latipes]|uniref:uncharacterized protein LOC111946974 n=1 Tax=Oryzias latipes TaxID=8090 RepID=UPI000CE254D0|nr:uncharacterized protein LOC111946974 [Oryzias latipes]
MENQREPLYSFLRDRNVSEDRISTMRNDKIDISVIGSMDDDSLATYVPIYGDRIATRRFCSEYKKKGERDAQRQSLLQKLKRKMGFDTQPEGPDHGEHDTTQTHPRAYLKNNKLAVRKTRKVELGWIHEGKQLHKKNGGGTRRIDLPKEAKKADILSIAKELFFPNGRSKKGQLEDFTFDILDYQEDAVLDENTTVGELYSLLKMGTLRFYLCTRERKESRIPEISIPDDRMDHDEPEDENSSSYSSNFSEVLIGPHTGEPLAWQLEDTLPISSSDEGESVSLNLTSATLNLSSVNQFVSNNSAPTIATSTEEPEPALMLPPSAVSILSSYEGDSAVLLIPSSALELASQSNITTSDVPSTSSVTEQPASTSVSHIPSMTSSDNEAHSNTELSGYDTINVNIKLHRTMLMDELITQFKDPSLLTCPLKFSFIDEIGADADGVSRDVYSAFWTEFLDSAAEGQDMRVPLLSPKWQEEEWKSVGRILVKGFLDHGYFPSRLAPAFTVALVFGEHLVSPDLLFESLLFYISPEERDLVNKALLEDLLGEEHEELLDLLDRVGAKFIPTRENLKAVLLNVAHKLIIQQPKYALDKMSEVARTTFAHVFKSQLKIQEMYENMTPTPRKVLKLLDANPTTQAESQSLRYLQQYIRGLDQAGLRRFLRFTTGSDVLCVTKIEVLFTPLDGVARRLVAHTCGPVLELPWTYLSFPELRVELDNILSSNSCYFMNIA